MIDHDWYLPILGWVVPAGFLGFLLFTLWTGKFYARGPVFTREGQPQSYWTGVAFIALCLGMATFMVAMAFKSN